MHIDVGRNFINPYLSRSTSEFWNRWHVSLNDWFIENLYIPLGGNRKGKARKYLNVFLVFLISGLWHGASWHFVLWGIINGIIVIVGQILSPLKKSIYHKLGIDENLESIVLLKRTGVFLLISLKWIFFNMRTIHAIAIIQTLFDFDFISFFSPDLLTIAGSAVSTFNTAILTLCFIVVQCYRQEEAKTYSVFCSQPLFFQSLLLAFIVCLCIFGYFSTDSYIDTQFIYFQF